MLSATGSRGADIVPSQPDRDLARAIFKELIEINTTDSSGNCTQAAEAMEARLKAVGLPAADLQVLGPDPRKGNLVARLRGKGPRRPLLLLAHLDVVEARVSAAAAIGKASSPATTKTVLFSIMSPPLPALAAPVCLDSAVSQSVVPRHRAGATSPEVARAELGNISPKRVSARRQLANLQKESR